MMHVCTRLFLVFVLAWSAVVAVAQQEPSEARPGPQGAKFAELFGQWKELLDELLQLKQEFRTAEPDRKKEIAKRYDELVKKGIKMQPKVVEQAEQAYLENPAADKDVEKFLVAGVRGYANTDNYEEALRLAEMLIANGSKEAKLYNWAGIAACAVGECDAAEEYLKLADEKKVLEGLGNQFFNEISYLKSMWQKEAKIRQAEAKADDLPCVLMKTSQGDIEIELLENEAPNTVANFISLVEKGFYDGLAFHRVLPQFMAQGGCSKGDGTGGPGYHIPCECHRPNYRRHFRGSLSMAHAGRDTGGSQFFLTFIPTIHLDGKHTVFGRVIKGMDVLPKLKRRDPGDPAAPKPDKIIKATVVRKRDHEYVPKKSGP